MAPKQADHLGSSKQPAKLTLVSLLGLSAVIVSTILTIFYVVPYYGFAGINTQLPWIMGVVMATLGGLVLLALALLIIVTLLGRDVPFSRPLRSLATRALLPVLVLVGKLVGLRREEVQHAFVAVNNELVMAQCRNGHPPHKILLLMPHCLQDSECTVKITHRVENCKRCGNCLIKDLLEMSISYGVDLAVATGGTIARRIVIERRPDLIIAVACERDLTSGIQDTTPLPVYGIFNERPFGPCLNTRVALERVDAVLREIASMKQEGS